MPLGNAFHRSSSCWIQSTMPVPSQSPRACPQAVPSPPIALRDKSRRWAEMQRGLVPTSGKGRVALRNEGHVFVSRHFASAQEFQFVRLIIPLGYRVSGMSEIVLKLHSHICLIKLDRKLLKGRGHIYFCLGLQGLQQCLAPWEVLPNTAAPMANWDSPLILSVFYSKSSAKEPYQGTGEEGLAGVVCIRNRRKDSCLSLLPILSKI